MFLLVSYPFPGNMETKLYPKNERINSPYHPLKHDRNCCSTSNNLSISKSEGCIQEILPFQYQISFALGGGHHFESN